MKKKINVAILVPHINVNTETFIQNHIKYIPQNIFVFYGLPFPYIYEKEEKTTLLERISHRYISQKKNKNIEIVYKEELLKKNLKKYNIDIVLAEYLDTAANVMPICRQLNIPIIATAFGYDISIFSHIKKYEVKYKALFDYCKNIVIVSEHMKKNLLELGCNPQKIVYSPTGPNPVFFETNPTFETKNIVAIGRFVEKKAPHITILAIHKVKQTFPDVRLIFAGNGPLMYICKDLVSYLDLNDNITFLDFINTDKQKEILEKSYMFIQHSRVAENGDSEGTPVAILEASAAGLPVVSTFHAGIPAVVKDKQTGYLVNEGNIEDMANKIKALLQNEETAKQFGRAGKKFIHENFSLQHHIDILNNLIEG